MSENPTQGPILRELEALLTGFWLTDLANFSAFFFHEIRDIKMGNKKIDNLRTAAFVGAIDKVAVSYQNLGIFP